MRGETRIYISGYKSRVCGDVEEMVLQDNDKSNLMKAKMKILKMFKRKKMQKLYALIYRAQAHCQSFKRINTSLLQSEHVCRILKGGGG